MNQPLCLLCNARGAFHRPGRLGRYAQTCDTCEQRRGSRPEHAVVHHDVRAGAGLALQWSARPR